RGCPTAHVGGAAGRRGEVCASGFLPTPVPIGQTTAAVCTRQQGAPPPEAPFGKRANRHAPRKHLRLWAVCGARPGISGRRRLVATSSSGQAKVESMARKYSRSASRDVERAMRKRKKGTLRSGRSKKKVKSRKQAIAIGLSEARRKGKKVPKRKSSRKRKSKRS